jgi:hypothetical protein
MYFGPDGPAPPVPMPAIWPIVPAAAPTPLATSDSTYQLYDMTVLLCDDDEPIEVGTEDPPQVSLLPP